jgi:hypothetical protein
VVLQFFENVEGTSGSAGLASLSLVRAHKKLSDDFFIASLHLGFSTREDPKRRGEVEPSVIEVHAPCGAHDIGNGR